MALEMKSSMAVVDDLASGASDGDQHQLHDGEGSSLADDMDAGGGDASSGPPLFDEFYDDWAVFDHAVAVAIEKHHPIRKRSSLTFEVYNRTVSKGICYGYLLVYSYHTLSVCWLVYKQIAVLTVMSLCVIVLLCLFVN